jgi:hypothetical protein
VAYSKSIFLAHVIKPQLPKAYAGTSDANFVLSSDGNSIVNNGSIALPEVDHWGTGYHPHVDSLSISVSGGAITTSVSGAFDITGLSGAYTNFSLTQAAHLQFDVNSKTISMVRDGDPQTATDNEIPWWDYAAAAFFGGLIVAIVDGVIYGVTQAVSDEVNSSNISSSGNLALANWTAASFQFPGTGQWSVLNCILSDSLCLRCTLQAPGTVSPPVAPSPHGAGWKTKRCEVADWFGGGR